MRITPIIFIISSWSIWLSMEMVYSIAYHNKLPIVDVQNKKRKKRKQAETGGKIRIHQLPRWWDSFYLTRVRAHPHKTDSHTHTHLLTIHTHTAHLLFYLLTHGNDTVLRYAMSFVAYIVCAKCNLRFNDANWIIYHIQYAYVKVIVVREWFVHRSIFFSCCCLHCDFWHIIQLYNYGNDVKRTEEAWRRLWIDKFVHLILTERLRPFCFRPFAS